MRYKIVAVLLALSAIGFQSAKCSHAKEISMNNQLLLIKAKCRENEQCAFEGKNISLDISIINTEKIEIGFPLEFAQEKRPIIRLVDNRTKTETYVRNNPPNRDLRDKSTIINHGDS